MADYKARILGILTQYWGYDSFRPMQEDIILSVMNGNDTLALLPTGGGKSICFQVPGLALDGLCIVISPLIALMKDQVANLRKRGIKASALYSGMSQHEIELVLNNCAFDPEYKFLYVSPERLKTDRFRATLQKLKVGLIAVDEAHCISQWGYDFRPPYLQIAEMRQFFPKTPILALTATATPGVVKDIQDQLHFPKYNVFQKSFKRDNLTYYVVREENKNGRMLRIMNSFPGTGIVYVRNRRKTQETAEFLKKNGISADFYHAGLDGATRDRKQDEWMHDQTRVIVSTNAFGMGIDKPDVRFVIHIDIPDTLEGYFQEAGRGGRDEKDSVAIMLYDDADIRELKRNFELTFPPIEAIRKVYNVLCNLNGIAIGDGEGRSFPFVIGQLLKPCGMNMIAIYNAIKFLEKLGIIYLNEDGKKKSQLSMKIGGDVLSNFEHAHPEEDEFIKLILRSYSGLFTRFVNIDEEEIAQRAGMDVEACQKMLMRIARMGVWSYSPRTEIPLITFLANRVNENYLYFSPDIYQRRKEVAQKRLYEVLRFVKTTDHCRSQLLLEYFGETTSSPCGKCDVCRNIYKDELEKKEFETIAEEVKRCHQNGISDYKELILEVSKKFTQEKVIKVVRWLIDQGKL
ncbi:MAG: RecQ family ATP-dependent DNA helicase [Bacteroidales bacterium]|nr:RecQ family ATP-dependent DNA helicase [Bacteroidales bacterium]